MEWNKLSPDALRKTEQQVNNFNLKLKKTREVDEGLGKNEFLKILTVQLSHQNPLEPMDNTQFISQMAQFTSLEQMQNMNQNLSELKKDFTEIKSSSLIGQEAVYRQPDGILREGVIDEVRLQNKNKVMISGKEVAFKDIEAIRHSADEDHPSQLTKMTKMREAYDQNSKNSLKNLSVESDSTQQNGKDLLPHHTSENSIDMKN